MFVWIWGKKKNNKRQSKESMRPSHSKHCSHAFVYVYMLVQPSNSSRTQPRDFTTHPTHISFYDPPYTTPSSPSRMEWPSQHDASYQFWIDVCANFDEPCRPHPLSSIDILYIVGKPLRTTFQWYFYHTNRIMSYFRHVKKRCVLRRQCGPLWSHTRVQAPFHIGDHCLITL